MAVNKKSNAKKQSPSTKSQVSKGGVSPKVKTKSFGRSDFLDKYTNDVAPALMKKFGYKSAMQIPKVVKIVFNRGVGEVTFNPKALDSTVDEIYLITNQRPIIKHAKKSIANFKLREGMPIGCKVTLRRERMYEFLDRLLNIAIPRARDFRGLNPKSFDGQGNYSLGVQEQIIFPEIDYDKIDRIHGLDICITTSAKNDTEGRALLDAFDFPFSDRYIT